MFPWELVFFALGWLAIIFIFDYEYGAIQRHNLMMDIDQYLSWVEMEQKEDENGADS